MLLTVLLAGLTGVLGIPFLHNPKFPAFPGPHKGSFFPHKGFFPHAFPFGFPKLPHLPKPKPTTTQPPPDTTTTTTTTTTTKAPEPKKIPHKGLFLPPLDKAILSPRLLAPKPFFPHAPKSFFPHFPKAPFFPHALAPHKPTAPAPTAPAPTTTRFPIDRSFCFDKKDGRYSDPAEGCAPYFIYCTAGAGRREYCPGGTFWDIDSLSCQYKKYVIACGGVPLNPEPTLPPSTQEPFFPYDCSGQADGYYENPQEVCSPLYVGCSGGQAWFYSCQPGLFYDVISSSCLAKEYVKWCGGIATEIPSNPPAPFNPPFKFDCFGLPDGQYEDPRNPCSADYVACVGGEARFLQCPGNLKYDILSDMCLTAVYVKWCGGVATERPAAPPADIPANPGIFFDCEGKPDGDYENPEDECSRFYFSCSGGVSTFRFCFDDSLRYDVISGECLPPAYVEWCGGVATVPTSPPSRDVPQAPFTFDCSAAEDGNYDNPNDPCSPWYAACSGGEASYVLCPENLIFDWDSGKCINAAYVAACHGSPTPEPTQGEPRPDVDFDCSGLETGFYADPAASCTDRYFSCNGGYAEALWCAGPTVYDVQSGNCLLPDFVAGCNGAPTERSQTVPPGPADEDPLCAELGEGRYGAYEGCTNEYFICAPGNIRTNAWCSDNTFWDEHSSQCLFKRQVVACGGEKDENVEPPRNPPPPPPPKIPHPILPNPKIPHFPSFFPKFLPHALPHAVPFSPKVLPAAPKIIPAEPKPKPAAPAPKAPAPKAPAPKAPAPKAPAPKIFAPHAPKFPHILPHFPSFFPFGKFPHLPSAPVNTKPNLPVDCRFVPDGAYGEKCGADGVFFLCEHGIGKGSATCPPGQLFNSVSCVPAASCH